MRTTTIIPLIAMAAALAAMMVAQRASTTARSADAAAAEIRRQQNSTEAKVRALRARLGAEDRSHADASHAGESGAGTQASAAATEKAIAELAQFFSGSSPRNQASLVKGYRASLPLDYYPLYRADGWSTERIAKFEGVMTEHFARIADLETAARENKLTAKDPAVAKLRHDEDERFSAALHDAIGEEEQRRFDVYQSEATLRRVASQMVGALSVTATPLEPAQVQQLTDVFRANGFARDGGERAVRELASVRRGVRVGSGDRASWTAVLAQARTFLSTAQFAELENQAAPALWDNGAMTELERLIDAEDKAKAEAMRAN